MAEIEYTKNLQSPAQFQRGDSLTVRAETVLELIAAVEEVAKREEFAAFFAPQHPLVETVSRTSNPVTITVEDVTDEAKPPSDIEAIANIEKHLGRNEPASPAQIAVAAKKSGKTVEELKGISADEARYLIREGSKQ